MTTSTKTVTRHEALFWSIAFPGFGQVLNRQVAKGLIFIFFEFLINVNSNFNTGIVYSFQGNFDQAAACLDFQWLLFYPCMYMFAMWDAFKHADGPALKPYTFLPFVFGAITVTVGLFYYDTVINWGLKMGPVFFPMLCLTPGLVIGFFLKRGLETRD